MDLEAVIDAAGFERVALLGMSQSGPVAVAYAARLCLSVRTVERHLSNIYAKLRVSGKAGRAAAAARSSRSREPPAVRN